MKVVCPCCGVDFPIDAGLNDADARRFAALMGELQPAVARLMPAYLRLHKPLKQGLRWSRMVSLLNDLAAEIKAAQVTHGGITYAAPADLWSACIEKVLAMPNLDKRVLALMKSPRNIRVDPATFGLRTSMRFARPRHVLRPTGLVEALATNDSTPAHLGCCARQGPATGGSFAVRAQSVAAQRQRPPAQDRCRLRKQGRRPRRAEGRDREELPLRPQLHARPGAGDGDNQAAQWAAARLEEASPGRKRKR
jgi:hypothetical protein